MIYFEATEQSVNTLVKLQLPLVLASTICLEYLTDKSNINMSSYYYSLMLPELYDIKNSF